MWLQRYGLYFAWLLACVGTLVSLYYSHIRQLEPCHLCWYQRMCLFPLTILLGIAAYRGFLGMAYYVLPLSLLGCLVGLYQIGIQEIPGWNPIDICGNGPSCVERVVVFGPFTIPMLSALLFACITALMTAILHVERKRALFFSP
ncbi:MAG: disulfide bond formation protein B [Verrucomicrobia bacterium]|nr:disulfide bond formation protein B [Verrucomicrobiota bacterium]MBS0647450.1 disulfide bond formation protein B [Verrucomicrobiota bacterium]